MRYEIGHPCVNDGDMSLWRDLGISSWPTLAVISPRGKLIATLPGCLISIIRMQQPTLVHCICKNKLKSSWQHPHGHARQLRLACCVVERRRTLLVNGPSMYSKASFQAAF